MQRPRHPCPTGAAAQEQGRFQGQCPEQGEPPWSCIPILHSTKRQPTSTAASSASSAWPLLKEGAGTDILHQLQDPKCLATAVPCGRCSRAPSTALGSAVTGTASLGTLPRGQGAEKRLQEVPEHSRRCQLLALLPSTCLAKGSGTWLHVNSRGAGMQAGSCSPSDTSTTPFRCWSHTGMCSKYDLCEQEGEEAVQRAQAAQEEGMGTGTEVTVGDGTNKSGGNCLSPAGRRDPESLQIRS